MNTETWLENNNRYLAASLNWLRLRLQRLLPDEQGSTPGALDNKPAPAASTTKANVLKRLISTGEATPNPPQAASRPSTAGAQADALLKAAAAERDAAAAVEPAPALVMLVQRLGLSDFERDILLLCAALEFDPALAGLCARIQGSNRNYPTFSLALSAFDHPSWDAVSAQRPLRYARLIEISQPGATPLTSSSLRADERIVNFLKGLNILDDRLAALLESLPGVSGGDEVLLAPSQQAKADSILERLRLAAQESIVPVVQLVGVDVGSRLAVAQQVCKTLNRRLYQMAIESLPSQNAEIETLARLWQRESVLLPVALYIDAESLEGATADMAAGLRHFLAQDIGVVFIGVRDTPARLTRANATFEIDKPSAAEQHDSWVKQLNQIETSAGNGAIAHSLAGQFDLNLNEIRTLIALTAKESTGPQADSARLWDACRDLARPRLDALAQHLETKATWDDLVLPDEQMRMMRQIAAQVRERHKVYDDWGFARKMNRGFGITALFAGESGTGKTMAAEVIANDLRLNLYRIDLSAVVSKYIGETEKNLRKLFDAAEQGGAILFFDEADALFGKRSEVKDSHDRYANIEINYLLQRMESFSGLAILATNMKSSLDPAFMRRLRFIVNFPFPGIKERLQIWQKALPQQAPKESIDYTRLAKLNVSGGNIHSIALNAAFVAAGQQQPVTMAAMLAAARSELKKLDKPFSEAEFR